ncbi:MAG: Alpha/beta-hydrolase [Aureobasidium pullulans]|nr:MAG: Alpha/beta-hydrolase [Aureobasidium pullulans]
MQCTSFGEDFCPPGRGFWRLPPADLHQYSPWQKNERHQMPPLFTPAQCNEARHLLRAILREATYLPDEQARVYVATHAVARFRDYTPGHKPDDILLQRRHIQLGDARKALSELSRANHGDFKPLIKLLHLTYARIGKRRHELLRDLQYKPLAGTDMNPHEPPQLTPQHVALLQSQKLATPPNVVRPLLRSWSLDIPKKNSWERPLPKKRLAKIFRDWYSEVLERTVVPLPHAEWNRLRNLALGKIKFRGVTTRRVMAASTASLPSPLEFALGLVPHNSPEVILKNSSNPIQGSHKFTARFMKRCWASVFAQCPVMSWDAKAQKWLVEWGCDVLDQEKVLHATDETILTKK